MSGGQLPAVMGPGFGLYQGEPGMVLVCRNETGSTLTEGHVGMCDFGRTQSGVTQFEGGDLGVSVFNTMVLPPSNPALLSAGIFVCHQSLSTEDASDGRFLFRGVGKSKWSSTDTAAFTHAIGFGGMTSEGELLLRYPEEHLTDGAPTPATTQVGKVIAIAREAADSADVAESWVDGWHGFATGVRE